jgi:hypothetical protein
MVLLKGSRAQAALESANEAVEHGEAIAARLNVSLNLLRSSRDALAEKMRCDAAAALTHQRDDPQTAVAVPHSPSLVDWIYLESAIGAYRAQRDAHMDAE